MAHEIMETDLTFTLEEDGRSWHFLDESVKEINGQTLERIFFNVVQDSLTRIGGGMDAWNAWNEKCTKAITNGKVTRAELLTIIADCPTVHKVEGWKALYADLRHRDDLEEQFQMVPLNLPRDSYTPISNREAWDFMQESLKDVDGVKISSAGTLGQSKFFYVSASVPDACFDVRKGDLHRTFFNLITSHDGSTALEMFPSITRIVCKNTFNMARNGANQDEIWKIYHSKNGLMKLGNLSKAIQFSLKTQDQLAEYLRELDSMELTRDEMFGVMVEFQASDNLTYKRSGKLSTQITNRANDVVNLAKRGKGNDGKTAYDLFNGFTEYNTTGEGVMGRKGSKGSEKQVRLALGKAYGKSEFGQAAKDKQAFLGSLLTEDKSSVISHDTLRERAKKGLEIAARASIAEMVLN